MMKCIAAGGICALLLCSLAAVATARSVGFLNRVERSASSATLPRCSGEFASDYQSYDVDCTATSLEIASITCTLDGSPYSCPSFTRDGLQFSVDLNDDDGSQHTLILNVQARYGNGLASLQYTFRFQRRVQQVFRVTCSATSDGQDVVVTCSRVGNSQRISSIQYSINDAQSHHLIYPTAASVASFRINGNDLINGQNSISLTITGESGVSRSLILTLRKTTVQSLSLRCGAQTSSTGISISCTSNRPESELTLQCYLDGVLQPTCGLSIVLQYSDLSEGCHNYVIVVTDQNGLAVIKIFSFCTLVTGPLIPAEPLRTSGSGQVEPLEFDCQSQTDDTSVNIVCTSNKQVSLQCYLDGDLQSSCGLENVLQFSDLSSGQHNFTVIAQDQDGLTERSESYFEEDPELSCRGSYNPYNDVASIDCDVRDPAPIRECNEDGKIVLCPSPHDEAIKNFVDSLINTRSSQTLIIE